ncbi:hypothetical protein ACFS5J_12315 [Flavobacterium chuncheonense]|uniref:Uncharacterized protein n=1 Tax=Flavobacterium chuncheonense TaxID=2026653 RepID=A0ABW5YNZ4_9FLAO
MEKTTISVILILIFQNIFSQEIKNCDEKLLNSEYTIDYKSLEEKIYEPIEDFSYFVNCGLDPIDIEICSNKMFFVTMILQSMENKEKVTHKEILEKILEIKNTVDYKLAKERLQTSKELAFKKGNLEDWKNDSIKLKKLYIPDNKIIEIKKIIDLNNNKYTFQEIFSKLNEK